MHLLTLLSECFGVYALIDTAERVFWCVCTYWHCWVSVYSVYAPIHTEWVFGVYAESINLTPLTECLEFMHLLTLMSECLVCTHLLKLLSDSLVCMHLLTFSECLVCMHLLTPPSECSVCMHLLTLPSECLVFMHLLTLSVCLVCLYSYWHLWWSVWCLCTYWNSSSV